MNPPIDLAKTKLGPKEREAVTGFCDELVTALGDGLEAIVLCGSAARGDYRPGRSDINLLVVLETIEVASMKKVVAAVVPSRRHTLAPIIASKASLRSSTDVFPMEYLLLKEAYQVLWGEDVLASLDVRREHLRLRCEQEIKDVLRKLRSYYVMSAGRNLGEVMVRTVGGFLETLRVTISVLDGTLPSRVQVVDVAARTFGIDGGTLRQVIMLRSMDVPPPPAEAEELYDRYMALVDRVAITIDETR
ncbi:MAG: nucleotidyltransferase domain-containing protein [Candidatus Riflebacteria bacterium]|nr:nucleotidyltransferase domain-containing protein [Candidatus Riflebacteria bacterium]